MLAAGGNTARPTRSIDESISPRKAIMPERAFAMSEQPGSLLPFESWHIDPVRSNTNITSSGTALHGEQAVACTLTGIDLMPISCRNVVGTAAVSSTTTVFAPRQVGSVFEHTVCTLTATLGTPGIEFFDPVLALYWYAVLFAIGAVREARRAGQRGGVGRRLQLDPGAVCLAQIDHEACEQQDADHEHQDHRQRLASLVAAARFRHPRPPQRWFETPLKR